MLKTVYCVAALMLTGTAAAAQGGYADMDCGDLWAARNAIYKEGGYCFKTQRAIRYFGNAGCQYDDMRDVPLSQSERRAVSTIQHWERAKRCPQ